MWNRLLVHRTLTQLGPVAAQFSELWLEGVTGTCGQPEESCLCTLWFLEGNFSCSDNISSLLSAWKSFRMKTAIKNILKIHCWVCLWIHFAESYLRAEIQNSHICHTASLLSDANLRWGFLSSLRAGERRQRGTLREGGLFSGMYARLISFYRANTFLSGSLRKSLK